MLRYILFATTALALIGLPAPAQSQNDAANSSPVAQAVQSTKPHAMSADKLRQSLQKAGFKDVSMIDAAFLVHARTSEGNMIVMSIDPKDDDDNTGASSGSSSGAQAQAGERQRLKSSLEKAGFQDVTIVDAKYLFDAETADGRDVRIMIDPPTIVGNATGASGASGSAADGQRR